MGDRDERGSTSSMTAIVLVVLLLIGLPCVGVVCLLILPMVTWLAHDVPVIKPPPPIVQPAPPIKVKPQPAPPIEPAAPIEVNPLRSDPAPEGVKQANG
jgi:hypothetical protein